MLNLNQPLNPNGHCYKMLIYDDFCKKIIDPLMSVKDLLRHGVTLNSPIDKKLLTNRTERDDVPDVAVYFVQPTESNIQKITADASTISPYVHFHLNFSSSIPRPLLHSLASQTLSSGSVARLAKHLMNAVNSLPEMKARKEMIDKHTNIATNLLGEIKERSLDVFTEEENEMMKGGSIDIIKVLAVLNEKETEAVEAALPSADSASSSNVVDWAEKLYDHSISAVTAGVKNLLSSNQQLAVARTVEALAKGQPNLETDPYIMLDPKASKTGSSGCSHVNEPFREAIVFMVGGGNYIEYNSLQELSQRNEVVKNVITYNSFSSSIMQR
ncbi:BnaC03g67420D [Brassica napus]|uniref:Uncharacterized protein n=2 Tax=Brassica TaxID=3705 RepID=A0A3P6BIK1_BRAOL|nr:unnamed protein product [Brassica napus]CDY39875.1 BnaC03g67420D [Brassica napus]VDD00514.1 unnamed protein product [Brassica oleracea]